MLGLAASSRPYTHRLCLPLLRFRSPFAGVHSIPTRKSTVPSRGLSSEVVKVSYGGVPTFRFSESPRKQPPPTTSRRDPPLLLSKTRSDLYSFGIPSRIYSSLGSAFPLPARAILSTSFRSRSMPGEVTQIDNSEHRNTPSDDSASEESPQTPDKNTETPKVPTKATIRKQEVIARVNRQLSEGRVPSYFLYLMELGLDPDQIKRMILRYPSMATATNVEGKIKELVPFLVDLGASRSDICKILSRRPDLYASGIQENIVPKMDFLRSLGVVDKSDMLKIMCRCPGLFLSSIQNLKQTVDCIVGLGVPFEKMKRIIIRSPKVLGSSVEKIATNVNYLSELGIPAGTISKIVIQLPQILGLSVEKNLRPTTEFFFARGFTSGEIVRMLSNFGIFYGYSMAENLGPKWEFFLEMGYPRADLVSFPQYFGYSLECRIKPRFNLVRKNGLSLKLARLLKTSEADFNRILENFLKKK